MTWKQVLAEMLRAGDFDLNAEAVIAMLERDGNQVATTRRVYPIHWISSLSGVPMCEIGNFRTENT